MVEQPNRIPIRIAQLRTISPHCPLRLMLKLHIRRYATKSSGMNWQCEMSRLTPGARRVIYFGIRSGKPVRDRRCPATVRLSVATNNNVARSSSQATGRVDGAVRTFAGEGGFRSFLVTVAGGVLPRSYSSLLAPSISIREAWAGRRWTNSTTSNLLTMRSRRDRGVILRHLRVRSRRTPRSSC